ncbi:MAG: membrane protein insertase YidC [Myxococcales bacterium]|nr:membrane protein insertase YidC [Myxococcales bacterium]
MDNSRRTLLAIVICVLIWITWSTFIMPPPPEGAEADVPQQRVGDERDEESSRASQEEEPAAPVDAAKIVSGRLESDLIALDVTNVSGIVKAAELLNPQFQTDGHGLDFLELGGEATLQVGFDPKKTDFKIPRNAAWEVIETGDKRTWNLRHVDANVEINTSLVLLDDYEGRFTVKVTNKSGQPQEHRLMLTSRLGEGTEKSQYNVHRGLCATTEDVEDFDLDDVEESPEVIRGAVSWIGLDTKYFLWGVIPSEVAQRCEITTNETQDALVAELYAKGLSLSPGETRGYEFGLYFGTKELERLRSHSVVGGVNLEDAIDWGWFGGLSSFLGKLMLRLLRFFHELTGIWGVAILLLTVVIKGVTLPLTLKQMGSMKRMKEIQPEIENIKKKYADDRQRQAQEMQALFARSGVNPLAGCLPMFVQLPIWIALYAMLATAVELFRVPFLWLPDLTQQDPYFILPLGIGGLMFLQTKLQPTPTGDNQQAKMMMFAMPIIFTVMMLFLPSGLGVYIFANILLSLVQTIIQTRPGKTAVAKAK